MSIDLAVNNTFLNTTDNTFLSISARRQNHAAAGPRVPDAGALAQQELIGQPNIYIGSIAVSMKAGFKHQCIFESRYTLLLTDRLIHKNDDMISTIVSLAVATALNSSTTPFDGDSTSANFVYTPANSDIYNDSNATSNFTDHASPVFPSYIRTTSVVFCVIIMCLGVVGNVMVPIVIFKTKDMRNSTNIFLVNLSVADLMVLLVCTPTVLVEDWNSTNCLNLGIRVSECPFNEMFNVLMRTAQRVVEQEKNLKMLSTISKNGFITALTEAECTPCNINREIISSLNMCLHTTMFSRHNGSIIVTLTPHILNIELILF
ncbi:unnamed protein product [Brassicogethes aeneus]|uniref:G-protein coupled receptors family 1 profile domain-containing protein n=1 Tax=Brassicogethes aeneus TaxID=1431903 RepID=A0A9P0B5B4_BRAAE|nr:unnamed protein product [Brassicogethes aeneus]